VTRRARQDEDEPQQERRLAIHDPAALAWGAAMVQVWLERRRRRLAAEAQQDGGGHDDPR
jgi:hypothetical protein